MLRAASISPDVLRSALDSIHASRCNGHCSSSGSEACVREPNVCQQHHGCAFHGRVSEMVTCQGNVGARPTCSNYVHQAASWHANSPPQHVSTDNDQLGLRRGLLRLIPPRHAASRRAPSPTVSRTYSPTCHSSQHIRQTSGSDMPSPAGPSMITPTFDPHLQATRNCMHAWTLHHHGTEYRMPPRSAHHSSDTTVEHDVCAMPRVAHANHQAQHQMHGISCPFDRPCPHQQDGSNLPQRHPFRAECVAARPTVIAPPVMAFAPLSPAEMIPGSVNPVPVSFTHSMQPVGVMTGSFMTQLYVNFKHHCF